MKPDKSKKKSKSNTGSSGMPADNRFSEIKTDPRYLEMPRKQKKVVIDSRFKEVLDKKSSFNTISKFDKTGKKVDT